MTAALIAWLLKHETLAAWGVVALLSVATAGGLYLAGRHAEHQAEQPKIAAAQAQAATATAQTGVVTTAAAAADTAADRTIRITNQAEEAVHDVQSAPGASDALAPELLARWRAGLGELRADAAPAPDGAGGADPAGALPAPGG